MRHKARDSSFPVDRIARRRRAAMPWSGRLRPSARTGLLVLLAALVEPEGISAQGPGPAFPGYSTAPPRVALPAEPVATSPAPPGAVGAWPSEAVFQDPPILPAPVPQGRGAFSAVPAPDFEEYEPFELGETMAQVGDHYVLKGELIGDVNLLLYADLARLEKLPAAEQQQRRSAILSQREPLVDQLLQQAIDRKLMYLEFLREVPSNLDEKKLEETRKEQTKRVNDLFRTQLAKMVTQVKSARPEEYARLARQNNQLFRIALVMKEADIESQDDPRLDRLLRQNKTSLPLQQQAFMERTFGQVALSRKLNVAVEVTHEEMLAYYREHLDEFQIPTRARWEQLSVLFKRTPDREVAGQLIADMGNQVYLGGARFEAVARKHSQEKNAERGGYHDWTVYNDLSISRPIHDAVFSLPINELSDIIADEDGWHIIRVLEREEAHVRPFSEAQVDITTKLKSEIQNKAYRDYLADLRRKTPIWTVYDRPATATRPRQYLPR